MLTERLDDLQSWIAQVLGAAIIDDQAARQLREMVRVFLDCDGSYVQAAARLHPCTTTLHLHKNTVHYRVRKAEEPRGLRVTSG